MMTKLNIFFKFPFYNFQSNITNVLETNKKKVKNVPPLKIHFLTRIYNLLQNYKLYIHILFIFFFAIPTKVVIKFGLCTFKCIWLYPIIVIPIIILIYISINELWEHKFTWFRFILILSLGIFISAYSVGLILEQYNLLAYFAYLDVLLYKTIIWICDKWDWNFLSMNRGYPWNDTGNFNNSSMHQGNNGGGTGGNGGGTGPPHNSNNHSLYNNNQNNSEDRHNRRPSLSVSSAFGLDQRAPHTLNNSQNSFLRNGSPFVYNTPNIPSFYGYTYSHPSTVPAQVTHPSGTFSNPIDVDSHTSNSRMRGANTISGQNPSNWERAHSFSNSAYSSAVVSQPVRVSLPPFSSLLRPEEGGSNLGTFSGFGNNIDYSNQHNTNQSHVALIQNQQVQQLGSHTLIQSGAAASHQTVLVRPQVQFNSQSQIVHPQRDTYNSAIGEFYPGHSYVLKVFERINGNYYIENPISRGVGRLYDQFNLSLDNSIRILGRDDTGHLLYNLWIDNNILREALENHVNPHASNRNFIRPPEMSGLCRYINSHISNLERRLWGQPCPNYRIIGQKSSWFSSELSILRNRGMINY